jgi:ribosomal RNA-processing protein 7
MVNVPPDATSRDMTLFFGAWGTIERVIFDADGEDDPTSFLNVDSDSDDSDEEDNDGDEDDEMAQADQEQPKKRNKKGKNKQEKDAKPVLIPLPSASTPPRTLRPSGKTAHLIWLDESSLQRCLAALTSSPPKKLKWPPASSNEDPTPTPSGLSHYLQQHTLSRPPLSSLRAHVDSYMALYDYALLQQKRRLQKESKYRKGEAIVDEDGFTLVVRGGAYGQTVGGGIGVASKKWQEEAASSRMEKETEDVGGSKRSKKKKKDKEKTNFYAFQKAEKQRSGTSYLTFRVSFAASFLLLPLYH